MEWESKRVLTAAVTVTETLSQHLLTAHAVTRPAELTLARMVVLGLHWYLTPAWKLLPHRDRIAFFRITAEQTAWHQVSVASGRFTNNRK